MEFLSLNVEKVAQMKLKQKDLRCYFFCLKEQYIHAGEVFSFRFLGFCQGGVQQNPCSFVARIRHCDD